MSVIYKVITRPTDPRVPNSPKRYYPHLITLGQSVNLKYIAQKMQDRSSLSVGDIKSVIQNFVEKSKHPIKYPFSLLYFHCTFAFAILHELLTYFHYDTRTI